MTYKSPELVEPSKIKKCIKEAQQYVSLENLRISLQCVFASTEAGNRLMEEGQWKKIEWLQKIVTKFDKTSNN